MHIERRKRARHVDDGPLGLFGRALRVILQLVIAVYAAAILGFVWLTKDMTFVSLTRDPVFAGYSITVVLYVLGRFVGALFYRSKPDVGYRPSVSVIIPAFNEGDRIIGTIQAALAADYPAELIEVIAVNDGSTDDTWAN